eukprot:159981-Pyramimonas_sp.AAC.1
MHCRLTSARLRKALLLHAPIGPEAAMRLDSEIDQVSNFVKLAAAILPVCGNRRQRRDRPFARHSS